MTVVFRVSTPARLFFFAAACLALCFLASVGTAARRPNILMIAVDDLNDWTGFLGGHPQAQTPNLDRLASRGVNFTNAHCPAPACSPCRNALLFGVEPFHSGLYPFYNLPEVPREVLARYTSLPRFFKDSGYRTFGSGKVHHGSLALDGEWTEYRHASKTTLPYKPEAGYQMRDSRKMAFCPTDGPDEQHHDYQVASYGVEVLSRPHDEPFFLAVGIVKPHLAFVCPERFFDELPQEVTPPPILATDHDDIPWAGRAMSNIRDDVNFRRDRAWNRVRRAYLACVAWADWNIGRVLDALDASPYADNTVVVLWSDHGYHHGEKRSFRKFSLWEEATRVPFIIDDRRQPRTQAGRACADGVSIINVYRTLADLAGLEPPEYVDGESLAPQLKDPEAPVSRPAIITWGRGNYAVRDRDWRYIRYFDGSQELYNHGSDPNEQRNLASDPDHLIDVTRLKRHVPTAAEEAPLVREGIYLWNVADADKPSLDGVRRQWEQARKKLDPPLAE